MNDAMRCDARTVDMILSTNENERVVILYDWKSYPMKTRRHSSSNVAILDDTKSVSKKETSSFAYNASISAF